MDSLSFMTDLFKTSTFQMKKEEKEKEKEEKEKEKKKKGKKKEKEEEEGERKGKGRGRGKKRMMDIVSGKLFLHYVLFVPGKETVIFLTLKQNLNH